MRLKDFAIHAVNCLIYQVSTTYFSNIMFYEATIIYKYSEIFCHPFPPSAIGETINWKFMDILGFCHNHNHQQAVYACFSRRIEVTRMNL